MRFITFLKLNNTTYVSDQPSESTDIPIPNKPFSLCEFDRESFSWRIHKKHIFDIIKKYKNDKINEGLIWKEHIISIDDKAIESMTSIKSSGIIFKTFSTIQWKTKDDSYLELDKKTFLEMYDKALEVIQLYFLIEKNKRDEVSELLTNEAVINWLQDETKLQSGWPNKNGIILMEKDYGDSSTM